MKTAYATLIFLLLTTIGRAHDYFFAFAEMEYNNKKEIFEVTLESAAHDVVQGLQNDAVSITDLSKHYNDSTMNAAIEVFINNHFTLSSGGQRVRFHLDGYEVLRNGLVLFYLSSDKIQPASEITCRFDWLMDEFPDQQNKLTLNIHNHKFTAVFLSKQPEVTINILEE